jgi:hypothetical protein
VLDRSAALSKTGKYSEELYFLEYNTVQTVERQPMFTINMSPPSSGLKSKPSKESASCFMSVSCLAYTFDPENGADMFL